MITELIDSFATGFCIGAVGTTVAVIIYVAYKIVGDMKEDK